MRTLFALLVAGTLFAGCGGDPVEGPVATVEDFSIQRLPGGARFVQGVLVNPNERDLQTAIVQITLLDDQNNVVSNMNVEVYDVPSGSQKPFRQAVDADDSVARARVKNTLSKYEKP
ncbi:MAG: FxLYD domain-containing protein [Bacteroidota bacterium]